MKYEFTDLLEKQKELDKYIKDKINIGDMQYWQDRVTALNVEINELINEIRFFKYWSSKGASKKSVILDEYVDCIHFALSLSNTLNIDELIFITDDMKRSIPLIYFELTEKISKLIFNRDEKLLKSIIWNIVEIAWSMNYSMNDILDAYNIKNKINYERQNTGY